MFKTSIPKPSLAIFVVGDAPVWGLEFPLTGHHPLCRGDNKDEELTGFRALER